MAVITYRANLNVAAFPFVSLYQGQTVIVKQADNTYTPAALATTESDKDVGIPQLYYCHNVMPSVNGVGSIGFDTPVTAAATVGKLTSVFRIRDNQGNKALFASSASGRCLVQLGTATTWVVLPFIAGTEGKTVTSAIVNGETYIYFSRVGCYRYNFSTQALDAVTLSGLTPADILGIVAVAGYMVAYSKEAVAWSSTLDPLDFVPSLSTGAGGGSVEGVKGSIVFCAPIVAGFIVYATENAVACAYSGNERFPFNFREIQGAGGLSSAELVAADGNTGTHFAYTSAGMQSITVQSATVVLPEVTDFLAGRIFEDFNEETQQFIVTELTQVMNKKITTIANRYVVISYGVLELTHAIVYDIGFKRYGKIKVDHVDAFEYAIQAPTQVETPKSSIGFLQADGTIKVVNFSYSSSVSSGVFLLGKYQYVRNRLLQLNFAEIENIKTGDIFKLYNLPSMDGKAYDTSEEGYLLASSDNYRKYSFGSSGRNVGKNHSLLGIGSFFLVSLVLNFNVHGRI
jgi:hypothetical protein